MKRSVGLVSIITPFKNSMKYFEQTYYSVISQTYSDFEWIIIDDNSMCDEKLALKEICQDSRITILENTELQGAGGARNTGLNHVSGKYITFIDSDDIWEDVFIEKSVNFILENEINSCFSGYNRYLENKKEYMLPFIPSKSVSSNAILAGCDISCLTFLGLTQYLKSDVRFGDYRARNDLCFFYKYLIESGESYSTNSILATYRLGKKSISSNKIKLFKYQYLTNRYVAGNSILKSVLNVMSWAIYGLIKYK